MALFQDKMEESFEEQNGYLDDPQKGIELVRTLIQANSNKMSQIEFDRILDEEVFPIIAELELKNEAEIYRAFHKISDKIKEQKKIQLLSGKSVVGIGGKFSAGKSCFINSITNASLPEGQRPTTSIATYIINAKEASNIAITNSDECIQIDDMAVEALTHEFYERYHMGFSKIIKNLVVYTPDFTYPNIAILDTPGYSKSDANKSDDSSDAELAREQLRSVDHLIWLVDVNQGTITQRDFDFIASLNISSGILVVFTKASQRTKGDLKKIVEEARATLKSTNSNVYDVIAYDSLSGEEILGEGVLDAFFKKINDDIKEDASSRQITGLGRQLKGQMKDAVKELLEWNRQISEMISKTTNIEHIDSLIKEYVRSKVYEGALNERKDRLQLGMDKLMYEYIDKTE